MCWRRERDEGKAKGRCHFSWFALYSVFIYAVVLGIFMVHSSAGLQEVNLRSYKYRDDNALDQAEGNSEITDGKQTVNGEQQAHLARLRAAGQVSYFKL